jgi:hypothetical protein
MAEQVDGTVGAARARQRGVEHRDRVVAFADDEHVDRSTRVALPLELGQQAGDVGDPDVDEREFARGGTALAADLRGTCIGRRLRLPRDRLRRGGCRPCGCHRVRRTDGIRGEQQPRLERLDGGRPAASRARPEH